MIIKNRADILFRKAKNILREEGVISFMKKVLLFSKYCMNVFVKMFFSYETVYIYENRLDKVEFTPPNIKDFSLRIITAPEQIDELLILGFDLNFHANMGTYKEKLDKGGILIYGFVGKKLVHTNWMALSKEANFDPYPYKIDWQHEACMGPSFTMPEYRSKGINAFAYSEMFRMLKEKGRSKAKFTIAKSNIAHRKSQAKVGSEVAGKCRLLKILCWRFWIEKPTKWIKL